MDKGLKDKMIDKETALLMLRNAIADKEWHIACANMETSRNGKWSCDWYEGIREAQQVIDRMRKQLEEK